MPIARANGIDICHDTFGDPKAPALLLVMGLGGQMTEWEDGFCELLAGRGFFVVRFDNRDVGLSTKVGAPSDEAHYTVTDMAQDAVGLLDALGIEAAHVVGASLGGMIVQRMAIHHPQRVLTMTSMMTTSWDGPRTLRIASAPPQDDGPIAPPDREEFVTSSLATLAMLAGPRLDESRARSRIAKAFDRSFCPRGVARQLAAALREPDRTELLKQLRCPVLVIHGRHDPTPLAGAAATAQAIPDAEFMVIEDMGHAILEPHWDAIATAIQHLAHGGTR